MNNDFLGAFDCVYKDPYANEDYSQQEAKEDAEIEAWESGQEE